MKTRMGLREAATRAGKHPNTIRRAIHLYQDTGKQGLRAHEPNGSRGYLISETDFERWIEGLPPA